MSRISATKKSELMNRNKLEVKLAVSMALADMPSGASADELSSTTLCSPHSVSVALNELCSEGIVESRSAKHLHTGRTEEWFFLK
jgi:predicted ArsR family transcriptional regulator